MTEEMIKKYSCRELEEEGLAVCQLLLVKEKVGLWERVEVSLKPKGEHNIDNRRLRPGDNVALYSHKHHYINSPPLVKGLLHSITPLKAVIILQQPTTPLSHT